jgi:hypothetical protein
MNRSAWHRQPAAQTLIVALYDLDKIARRLEPFADKLWQHDPESVIGKLEEQREPQDGFNGHWTYSADPGASAVEACLESLTDLRDAWTMRSRRGAFHIRGKQHERPLQPDGRIAPEPRSRSSLVPGVWLH